MKLIVGLGNPGYQYHLTPHNLGFMAVDRLAEHHGVSIERPEAQALTARVPVGGEPAVLAKPMTFMNLSGLAVGRLLEQYQLSPKDLIVLVDDADLPFGALRVRVRGSAGTHNGLKSIIGVLESDSFARVRMGIRPAHELGDLADYVLSPFRGAQLEDVAELIDRAAEAVLTIVSDGPEAAMNRFNRSDAGQEQ